MANKHSNPSDQSRRRFKFTTSMQVTGAAPGCHCSKCAPNGIDPFNIGERGDRCAVDVAHMGGGGATSTASASGEALLVAGPTVRISTDAKRRWR